MGAGFEVKLGRMTPFVELRQDRWSQNKGDKGFVGPNEAQFDYFDSQSMIGGMTVKFGSNTYSGSFGQFQSYLGDGIYASESTSGDELIGMQFQDIHAMPHSRAALGYRKGLKKGHIQTGLAWLNGKREVWDKARGNGSYELNVYSIIFGGVLKF
jgi:hypothetical protein